MKQTMIFMLLCAAMAAFSFTACDSLIPNDLPTEEENTQGGNGNPGGSDGTEDEGGSGNIEDEDPTPEMKGCNPCVNFGRLVKSMNYDNFVIYEFEYDEFGRYKTLKLLNKIDGNWVVSDIFEFTYFDTYAEIDITGMLSNGTVMTETVILHVNEEGYITSFLREIMELALYFEYDQNNCCSRITGDETFINNMTGDVTFINQWSDGNLINGYVYFFTVGSGQFTYLNQKNKMNISIYDPDVCFQFRFKGLYSRNYIKTWDTGDGISTFTYEFDNDGYVTSMVSDYVDYESSEYNYSSIYTFTYYE